MIEFGPLVTISGNTDLFASLIEIQIRILETLITFSLQHISF